MSRFFNDYNQYLGSQRCCNLRTQGNPGPEGPTGPAIIGPRGNTGPAGESVTGPTGRGCRGPTGEPGPAGGPTGQTGPIGGSPWSPSYYQGVTGYTGTGYTGDVIVFGALYVQGGIDPTYLALEPQSSGPAGFTNPLWVDNSGNLRSDKILLQSGNGTGVKLNANNIQYPATYNTTSAALDTTSNAVHTFNINVAPFTAFLPNASATNVGTQYTITNTNATTLVVSTTGGTQLIYSSTGAASATSKTLATGHSQIFTAILTTSASTYGWSMV